MSIILLQGQTRLHKPQPIHSSETVKGLSAYCCRSKYGPMNFLNLARTMRELKDRNIFIVGTAGETDKMIYDADLKGALAVVMGAEDTGMRRLTRENCHELVKIPMYGKVTSLNVSVATGVVLYEAVRQRLPERKQ